MGSEPAKAIRVCHAAGDYSQRNVEQVRAEPVSCRAMANRFVRWCKVTKYAKAEQFMLKPGCPCRDGKALWTTGIQASIAAEQLEFP